MLLVCSFFFSALCDFFSDSSLLLDLVVVLLNHYLGGTWKLFPHRSRIWSSVEVNISYQLGVSIKRVLSFISSSSVSYHWLLLWILNLLHGIYPIFSLLVHWMNQYLLNLDTVVWSALISIVLQLVWGWIQRFMAAALMVCNNTNILNDSGYYWSLEDEVLWVVSSWDHYQVLCIIVFSSVVVEWLDFWIIFSLLGLSLKLRACINHSPCLLQVR